MLALFSPLWICLPFPCVSSTHVPMYSFFFFLVYEFVSGFRFVILARWPTIKAAMPFSMICVAQQIPLSEERFPHARFSLHTRWENVSLIQFRTRKTDFCRAVPLKTVVLNCVFYSHEVGFEAHSRGIVMHHLKVNIHIHK